MAFALTNALIVVATVAGMKCFAWAAHKYVMRGWGWHASHHAPRTGWFERNDWYAVVFAGAVTALIALGTTGHAPLQWINAGMTLCGLPYFLAHDGLVHKRSVPRSGYFKRLHQAHRLHHAAQGPQGCVSFGFLWAPSPAALKRQLQEKRDQRGEREQRRPSA